MEATTKYKIICDNISALGGDAFQELCNRLCLELHPDDYTPVRAGGSKGDMKNDGYCPKARIYFAAHATRGEKIAKTKEKISSDLTGCLGHHSDVKEWVYLTNDTLVGEIHTYIDEEIRPQHPDLTITTWDHTQIAKKISEMTDDNIEHILGMSLQDSSSVQQNVNAPGGIQVNTQAKNVNNLFNIAQKEERDFGILKEIIDFMIQQTGITYEADATEQATALTNLKGKIAKNFAGAQKTTVDEVVLRTWGKRNLVQKFVQTQTALDSSRVDALIMKLQSDYRHLKGDAANHHIAVEDYSIIEAIAKDCIPEAKSSNPDYIASAVAVVLYFFELCNFGKK